jgi:HD superfamily phosphohydrolase/serine/threonine protein kinase
LTKLFKKVAFPQFNKFRNFSKNRYMRPKHNPSRAQSQHFILKDIGLMLAALKGIKEDDLPKDFAKYAKSQLNHERKQLTADPELIELKNARLPALRFAHNARVMPGGGGIVIECLHEKIDSLRYALKVNRPSLYPQDEELNKIELRKAKDEYLKHAPLTHPNICRAFFHEVIMIPSASAANVKVSATLMEWIDGACDLGTYLNEKCKGWQDVVSVVKQCFQGLAYLHESGLVHWDIKSDNIQVDRNGTVKIMDFGNSRYIAGNARLDAQSSDWNVPSKLLEQHHKSRRSMSSKRATFSLPDASWDTPWLDMWMLAREFNRLLEADISLLEADKPFRSSPEKWLYSSGRSADFQKRCFPADDDQAIFVLKFLRLILRRLLKPQQPSDEAFYKSADLVVADLDKLAPEFGAAQCVLELQAVPQHVMRLPHCGNAPYTRRAGKLYNSIPVRRLSKHLQLATLVHVYPGASHRRHEHVAGVMAAVVDYVRALYSNRTEPFWRLSIEAPDIEALIVAALLHDVGHFGFAHYLEEMAGIFKGFQHEDYILGVLDETRNTHIEVETTKMMEADRKAIDHVLEKYWKIPVVQLEAFRRKISHIIELPTYEKVSPVSDESATTDYAKSGRLKLEILHSIINSSIDADKFDYLVRDALHCGVPYAQAIDTERFYQSLTVIPHLPSDAVKILASEGKDRSILRASIGVTEKGVLPIESILLARYQLFFAVYWHHTGRAESAMLQYLVQKLIDGDALDEEGVRKHLEEIIQYLRNNEDAKALEEFRRIIEEKRLGDKGTGLLNIIAGLSGNRKHLYWPAFELQYEGDGNEVRSQARLFNEVLSKCFDDVHNKKERKPILAALADRRKEFRKLFLKEIMQHLATQNKKSAKSKKGKQNITRQNTVFADHDILLDIPPAGKDQVENIFVSNGAGRVRSIRRFSPIADVVGDAFKYWVRRVRVFLSRPAWYGCNDLGLSDDDVQRLCAQAMRKFVEQEQQELF